MKKRKLLLLPLGQISLISGAIIFGYTIEEMSLIQYLALVLAMTGGYLVSEAL